MAAPPRAGAGAAALLRGQHRSTQALTAAAAGAQGARALEKELGAPACTLFAGDVVADSPSAWADAFKGATALVMATSAVPVVTGPPGPDGRPSFGFKAGQTPEQVDWEGQRRQLDTAFEHGVQRVGSLRPARAAD